MREAVLQVGGTIGPAATMTHVGPPVSEPFGSAEPVETPRIEAREVGGAGEVPDAVAFVDGIQRYAVEARFGLEPVVRAHASAAVLGRVRGQLEVLDHESEEFLVTALDRLTPDQRAVLGGVGLRILDSGSRDRAHPLLDVRCAALVVERRRDQLETALIERHLANRPTTWLVVDGSIAKVVARADGPARLVGLIKSHETQFLDGADLRVALTLAEGHRTTVFRRDDASHGAVYSWYLRLWPWEGQDLLHGLVRLERPPTDDSVRTASEMSRWVLAERTPLSTPDRRWDRLVYPIQQVEAYLRAQLGSWW